MKTKEITPQTHFRSLLTAALERHEKRAGVAIPVFSLRSNDSFGIGDFGDLKLLIDWAKQTGMQIIQLLPINDTTCSRTWEDSYPYNAISVFALHPLYLNIKAMGRLNDPKRRRYFREQQKLLNALPAVDYEAVDKAKWDYFRELFAQDGTTTLASTAYQTFFSANSDWLLPYICFCARRDGQKDTQLYAFLQFHAHRQMKAAHDYAHRNGIWLKGDIAIGVNRAGVDIETAPQYFDARFQVGAPPDDFAATGQLWGFPAYHWPAMEADGYAWWKRRLQHTAHYFDAYRIDHVLGFFRIWQAPSDAENGLSGYFNPALPLSVGEIEAYGLQWNEVRNCFIEDDRQAGHYHPKIVVENAPEAFYRLHDDFFYRRNNEFWKTVGLKRLASVVDAADMLVCGEDLGMIPDCVPEALRELDILSLKIERMPKTAGWEFGYPAALPYLSVCTPSTHDMSTLRGWWREDREKSQRYYNFILGREGAGPEDLTPELAEAIVRRHLEAGSMLTIISWQDWLAIDGALRNPDIDAERINIPAHSRHYWRWRMHISLNDLIKNEVLSHKIKQLAYLRHE